jgi:ATP-dependent helicase Lhr and Lhr-like helicase
VPLSEFHPTVQRWFAQRFGEPTEPQRQGWPHIRAGRNTLIAAPTGMGKTIAAYLAAIDGLLSQGHDLPDETSVLYISPLRALSNDVQKNLQAPLDELAGMDPFLPEVRVMVRTGDTPQRDRAAMLRKPPHILVTTPESLYILLTSDGGRDMLSTVKTVIVDEIHALARDKRGSHLSLCLERLETLVQTRGGPAVQRIGLSATQKPLSEVGDFLVGAGRQCTLVDVGHKRPMDVAIVVPPSPLTTVCSHEQWDEIYGQIAEFINGHRTTLIFVNTRKLAERITARLTTVMGEEKVTCHHSSLSKERRLDAEHRLKTGTLKALVATASLELGIDIGDVDLVIQVGATRSIATFLQRVGRSGHAVRRLPKGRLFPLTIDELVEAAALLRAAKNGILDRTPQPRAPLDILSQQIVAECVHAGEEGWNEQALFDSFTRAGPYKNLTREDFDSVILLHLNGKHGLLHRDGVAGRIMARKRARLTAITGGGAIPDVADYRVLQEPEGTFIGTLNEDFAIESNVGDIFQLGNTSWRVVKVERGTMRVADAQGQPPTIPFWLGEGPSRTAELSAELATLREDALDPKVLMGEINLEPEASIQISQYIAEGRQVLGTVPTQKRLILERFFDESGGMQMVLHAPFGGKINRAWGLALRKRFCRGFGFELQAAANEEAIVISLGLQHSFPLEDVFNYLHPNTVKDLLTQAILDQPMFESRWRWNSVRSLVLARFQSGKPVAPQILRMRAGDLLALSFPAAVACPETMPPGNLPIPMEHPLVRQTIEDCLTEATDIAGLIQVLTDLREGRIERVAIDTPEPSAFARGILNSQAYTFLDDAPLEERRTQAVINRRSLDARLQDNIGALDAAAVERVRQEVWPQPESLEEVHDALLWTGFFTDDEAAPWLDWLIALAEQKRVTHKDGRWFALDGMTDESKILLGRLEALGPVYDDDPRVTIGEDPKSLFLKLQHEGSIIQTRFQGRQAWCERRLLARIHRYTIDRLRQDIEPVSAATFLQFLACWQHVDEEHQLEGPHGVSLILTQLAGMELPAWAWEEEVLPRRVKDYKREWLDAVTMNGEFAWGRMWGGASTAIRVTPIAFIPRDQLDTWLKLAQAPSMEKLCGAGRDIFNALQAGGAMFPQNLQKAASLVPAHMEMGLADVVSHGIATCDSFAALRQMITPPSRRRIALQPVGRWSTFRSIAPTPTDAANELVAKQLLARTGVVFHRMLTREKLPVSWSVLSRIYRRMELKGEARGGRFVAGFTGEQFALPQAVERLRNLRRQGPRPPITLASTDPLNFQGILTPEKRVAPSRNQEVLVG